MEYIRGVEKGHITRMVGKGLGDLSDNKHLEQLVGRLESVDHEVSDRFAIARRDGRRIEDESDQETLRLAVALIKQFTHFQPWAPDPALALRGFDQFLDQLMSKGPEALRLFASPGGLRELDRGDS